VALESFISKAICPCATPSDRHSNASARSTSTKDGWIAVAVAELHAAAAA
jgi:hypothetical protein